MTDKLEIKEEFLFKGENLVSKSELLFDRGCFVYGGYWFDKLTGLGVETKKSKKEAVIRRILKNDCLEDWQEKLKVMNPNAQEHLNTSNEHFLRCFGYEDGKDDWRYFAIEPYISTLYHYCNGQYEGPPLNEPQVVNQMISGIDYMNCNLKMPHGDLNPLNVLITHQQQIKLSDFGLSKFSYTKYPSGDIPIEIAPSVIICKRKYWLLADKTPIDPEVIENSSGEIFPTEMDDIFAAGCLIFYFLNGGLHPFGDDPESIESNMKEGNLVNMPKMKEEHAELYKVAVENMILQPKNKSRWWRKSIAQFQDALKLKIDRTKLLGEGSFAKVYAGNFHGVSVAVKEIERSLAEEKERKEHSKLDHVNVVKLLLCILSSDENYWHLVLELCASTLQEYCNNKYNGPMPTDNMVLYQIANGVDYIHSRNDVHRDLKPANILISKTVPVQMKVSDFGFVKPTQDDGQYSQSGNRGTLSYMAPELLKELKSVEKPRANIQIDTFSTGCVFFNFLTRGRHPFCSETINEENWPEVKNNMIRHNPVGLKRYKKGGSFAHYDLIAKMIANENDRIHLSEVMKYLTKELSATRQLKEVVPSVTHVTQKCNSFCFHPTDPILACGVDNEVILLFGKNSSIPFSNWKEQPHQEKEHKLQVGEGEYIIRMKWNDDGSLLAALSSEELKIPLKSPKLPHVVMKVALLSVTVWKFSGLHCSEIPWKKVKLPKGESFAVCSLGNGGHLEWNKFRPTMLAVHNGGTKVHFLDFSDENTQNLTFSIARRCNRTDNWTDPSLQWIAENLIALRLNDEVEIYEIDYSEQSNAAQLLRRRYDKLRLMKFIKFGPSVLCWDQRTKCFAALCEDECVKIWPMKKKKYNPIHSLKVDGHCRSLAWNPNKKKLDGETIDKARKLSSNFILTCGLDNGTILIWTPLEEKQVKHLSQHQADVHYLSYSPDGVFLASADCDRKLVIWSTKTWEPVFTGENEYLFSNISPWMSTVDSDYKLMFKSTQTKDPIRVIEYVVQSGAVIKANTQSDEQKPSKEKGLYSIGSGSNPDLT